MGYVKLWWKLKKDRVDNAFRTLSSDKYAIELAVYAENDKEEIYIYVEPVVSSARVVEFIEGSISEGVNVSVHV